MIDLFRVGVVLIGMALADLWQSIGTFWQLLCIVALFCFGLWGLATSIRGIMEWWQTRTPALSKDTEPQDAPADDAYCLTLQEKAALTLWICTHKVAHDIVLAKGKAPSEEESEKKHEER